MEKIGYVCTRDTTHNGVHYKSGQHWDGDLPAPQVGLCWSIWQNPELPPPSMGQVRWVAQPSRPQADPLTAAEMVEYRDDPYGQKKSAREEAAAPPPSPDPPGKKKEAVAPIVPMSLKMTEEEKADPYGIQAQSEAKPSGDEKKQPDPSEE